jgi:O-acetyl-ADP-ribose deacetylase (regulator of RNase III)
MEKIKINGSLLELVVGDITTEKIDAIVNAANKRLAPGGGVAGAIHRAAGPKLWDECKKLQGCNTGEAKITKGFNLPAHYIIHTVGPVYSGSPKDSESLTSCYRACLKLADSFNLTSIAFPALSTGYFGYPIKKAADIALKTVIQELQKKRSIRLVRFILYDTKSFSVFEKSLDSITNDFYSNKNKQHLF